MYTVHFYETRRGDYPVKDFVEQLGKRSRAKIWRYVELLQQKGPSLIRPYTDHVYNKIRELRILVNEGNIRIFYCFMGKGNIILLHAFNKKTDKLPMREILKAKRNMDDFTLRHERGELEL